MSQVRTMTIDNKWLQLLWLWQSLVSIFIFRGVLSSEFLNFSLHFNFILFLFVYLLVIVDCFKITFRLSTINTL